MKTIVSWNVNGVRAAVRKGFFDWFYEFDADIVGLQEIKAESHQLESIIRNPQDRHAYWNPCRVKKGYSGTALLSKEQPLSVQLGWGEERFDNEGRTIMAEYEHFTFFNIYFPNGEGSAERLQYKLEFYDSFLEYALKLKNSGRSVIFTGDVNTAHNEIDLARPKENQNASGFLPIERAWIDKVVESGFTDTFRYMYPETADKYSWWSYRSGARERNIGWRIDYVFISNDLIPKLRESFILDNVTGSDHCPVGIVIDV
ncbi:MAG: exodeoxyribonuclease III [Brevinemataceae bacterium]